MQEPLRADLMTNVIAMLLSVCNIVYKSGIKLLN